MNMKTVINSVLIASAISAQAEVKLYIAPNGNDGGSGTIDAPFKTLEKARDTIRELSPEERRQNIRVFLRGGTYKMEQPFVLNVQDGAPLGLRVSYEAFPGETPVLDSGVEITGWKKVTLHLI